MKDDRATFMKLSDSAMDDRAISMRTLVSAKVMGDRAYLYENFRVSAKVMTRATGLSL